MHVSDQTSMGSESICTDHTVEYGDPVECQRQDQVIRAACDATLLPTSICEEQQQDIKLSLTRDTGGVKEESLRKAVSMEEDRKGDTKIGNFWAGIENVTSVEGLVRITSKFTEDMLSSCVSDIEVSPQICAEDAPTLTKLLTKFRRLEEVELRDCSVTDSQLTSFLKCTEKPSSQCPKISTLSLTGTNQDDGVSFNPELSSHDIKIIFSLLTVSNMVKSLTMMGCDLTKDKISGFLDSSNTEMRIQKLDVSYNPTLGVPGMRGLGLTTKTLHLKELCLAGCKLEDEHVKVLHQALSGHQLLKLDVSDNPHLGEGVDNLAELLKECSTECLTISDCKLTSSQVKSFAKSLKGTNLNELDISDSERYCDLTYSRAICHLIPSVRKSLTACFKKLGNGCIEEFQHGLNECGNRRLHVVYKRTREVKEVKFVRLVGPVTEKCLTKSCEYKPH